MKNIFQGIPAPKVRKSRFQPDHDVKLSGDMGWLIPVMMQDVLPGEHWKNKSTFMVRFAPMLAPIMHLVYVTMHFFFTPNRILYEDDSAWENFIYAGIDGLNEDTMPYLSVKDVAISVHALGEETEFNKWLGPGSLWDYLGFPPIPWQESNLNYTDETEVNAFPFMVYQKIVNEYYRDETLMLECQMDADTTDQTARFFVNGGSAQDVKNSIGALRRKVWKKDQFTSALPWPQRGAEVLLPMEADVNYKDISEVYTETGGIMTGSPHDLYANNEELEAVDSPDPQKVRIENIESVTNGTITISDVRVAIVVQRWAEANARGGYRENEGSLSHFGQIVPDYRLKHPEYIGGGVQVVQVSENLSTANSLDSDENPIPQANPAGTGIAIGNSNTFSYKCPEHGWITGILCVMPKAAYQQGIPKKYLKLDRFDLAWPQFVGLGEQEISSKEIYYDILDSTENNDQLFGYQQRYWEYKYESDRVCGDFRNQLDFWHMGRKFDNRPVLDEDFLTGAPTKRIFAVEDQNVHSLWMVVHHDLSALRPMPYYSVPGLSKI